MSNNDTGQNRRLFFSSQFTLGGFEKLQSIKVCKREELGLPPLPEDCIRVIRSMRAASPPASASDLIEQQQKRARREHKVIFTPADVCTNTGYCGFLFYLFNRDVVQIDLFSVSNFLTVTILT